MRCLFSAASLRRALFTDLVICKLQSLHTESISQFIPQNIFISIFQTVNWPIVATLAGNVKLMERSSEEWSGFNLYAKRFIKVITSFWLMDVKDSKMVFHITN